MDLKNFLGNLSDNLIKESILESEKESLILDIANGKIKFLAIVESIQEVLTSENMKIREQGIEFLSWILTNVPKKVFKVSEISAIVGFYCDCLKGHHNLLPATLKGLVAIVELKETHQEHFIKILFHLFQNVNCRTQLQSDRYNIFNILNIIITNNLDDVKLMGPDLVYGLISFIEGETDPKCLLLIFNFLPLFVKGFDLGHLSEELFEVLLCYFPIDFNAATKDDNLITRENLAEGLLECLSSSQSFCTQCLPLIFDKLDSTFRVAQIDSYKLLKTCCQRLTADSLKDYLNQFWKNIQRDVLKGNDKELHDIGLAALTGVVWVVAQEADQNILLEFLANIIETLKTVVNSVSERMFQPAIKILVAASEKSKVATGITLCFLKSSKLFEANSLNELKIVLSSLLPFLKCCHLHDIKNSKNLEYVSCYIDLINTFLTSAQSEEYEVRKLTFLGIFQILEDLNDEFRQKFYKIIIDNIKTKNDIKISEEFLVVFRQLASSFSSEFYSILSKDIQIVNNQLELDKEYFLMALSYLADLPHFKDSIIPLFLFIIVKSPFYAIGLTCLLNSCRFFKEKNCLNFCSKIQNDYNVIHQLILWWKKLFDEGFYLEEKELLNLSEIILLITRSQNSNDQQFIVSQYVEELVHEISHENDRKIVSSSILDSNKLCHSIVILEAILSSIDAEVIIPNIANLRKKLVLIAINSPNYRSRLSSSRLLASFINKAEEVLACDMLKLTVDDILVELEKTSEFTAKSNCSFLISWLIKGVVLRGGPSYEEFVLKWFHLIGRKDIGMLLAENFKLVLEEEKLYLSLENHCNVRVLYRQRLFEYYTKWLKMFDTCEYSIKINYLLVLAELLQSLPIHLLQTEISNVVNFLDQCLGTNKLEVLSIVLNILRNLLKIREKVFINYADSFIPLILKLSKFENSMNIRIIALKCLFYYGFYPTFALLPHKNKVIYGLEFCLDDKKRLVRKEAVKARCRWFLVGSPGEDIIQS